MFDDAKLGYNHSAVRVKQAYRHGAQSALVYYGLTAKEGAVVGPVKMYRRVLEGLRNAAKSVPKGETVARRGFALHGTNDLANILSDQRIEASSLGDHGQHGGGVYWWRGFPREQYLTAPTHEGVLTDMATVGPKKPMLANIHSGHMNPQAMRTGPGDYKLRPKDYAVIDYHGRRADKSLPGVLADASDARLRKVDSSIFNQAYRDLIGNNRYNDGKQLQPPAMSAEALVKQFKKR